jgi:hypothetical protein
MYLEGYIVSANISPLKEAENYVSFNVRFGTSSVKTWCRVKVFFFFFKTEPSGLVSPYTS